ncbi:hypothetical protein LXL04_008985 [Taraxacum kok-saghyz]
MANKLPFLDILNFYRLLNLPTTPDYVNSDSITAGDMMKIFNQLGHKPMLYRFTNFKVELRNLTIQAYRDPCVTLMSVCDIPKDIQKALELAKVVSHSKVVKRKGPSSSVSQPKKTTQPSKPKTILRGESDEETHSDSSIQKSTIFEPALISISTTICTPTTEVHSTCLVSKALERTFHTDPRSFATTQPFTMITSQQMVVCLPITSVLIPTHFSTSITATTTFSDDFYQDQLDDPLLDLSQLL